MCSDTDHTSWFSPKTKADLSTSATYLLRRHGIDRPCDLSAEPIEGMDRWKERKRAKRRRNRNRRRRKRKAKMNSS